MSVGFREMIADNSQEARDHAVHFYHQSFANQIHVQHILYDVDDLIRFRQAMVEGILPSYSPHVLLVLGRYSANFQSDPVEMTPFISDGLADMASWSICAFGYREFDVMNAAIKNGGHCRVGFENNYHLKDGKLALTNEDLVRQLSAICEPATREQTLEIFSL